jgi:hypothetical protein
MEQTSVAVPFKEDARGMGIAGDPHATMFYPAGSAME